MIKVKHIQKLKLGRDPLSRLGKFVANEVLVAGAKLVLIEEEMKRGDIDSPLGNMKPILISETEKIEEGQVWDGYAGRIVHAAKKHLDNVGYLRLRKILAFPKHFSPQQLQMIVDGKLKDGDKVLVECTQLKPDCKTQGHKRCFELCENCYDYKIIKLNPYITIYPVEEKMYTVDQIITYLAGRFQNNPPMEYILSELSKGDLTKWFEQNVK